MKVPPEQVFAGIANPPPKSEIRPKTHILLSVLFIVASFIIYAPVINRYFVSDDFIVLSRVCLDHTIFIKRFFRPLSDISLFMNYKWAGLNPVVFNAFNILIHGINSYLVWLTCLFIYPIPDKENRIWFTIIASLIFLTYPFHNEAVVWLLGRGSSLACLFSLLAIIAYYKIENINAKGCIVCMCYFISLSAFESTIFFPFIFILLLIYERKNIQTIVKWSFILILTGSSHLLLRLRISGSILGSYGQEFFHSGIKTYILNLAKVLGRLIFPPMANAGLLILLFSLLIAFMIFFSSRYYSENRNNPYGRSTLFFSGILFISCIIPFVTGISTKTSETDRILYFPSVFLSMAISLFIVSLIKKPAIKGGVLFLILSYNLFFLEKNNMNWKKASQITSSIMEKVRNQKADGKVYFLNIPEEIEGAYVFRQGFPDALRLYGKNSSRFIVVNYIDRSEIEIMHKIKTSPEMARIELSAGVSIELDSGGCRQIFDQGKLKFITRPFDRIYFWNSDQLDTIQTCHVHKGG